MTIHLPEDLASSIRAEVRRGHFASEDALVAAAVWEYLRRHGQTGQSRRPVPTGRPAQALDAPDAQDLQRHLLEAGVLGEIKPPITDFTPYLDRQTIAIQGEPLSHTVSRDRR